MEGQDAILRGMIQRAKRRSCCAVVGERPLWALGIAALAAVALGPGCRCGSGGAGDSGPAPDGAPGTDAAGAGDAAAGGSDAAPLGNDGGGVGFDGAVSCLPSPSAGCASLGAPCGKAGEVVVTDWCDINGPVDCAGSACAPCGDECAADADCALAYREGCCDSAGCCDSIIGGCAFALPRVLVGADPCVHEVGWNGTSTCTATACIAADPALCGICSHCPPSAVRCWAGRCVAGNGAFCGCD